MSLFIASYCLGRYARLCSMGLGRRANTVEKYLLFNSRDGCAEVQPKTCKHPVANIPLFAPNASVPRKYGSFQPQRRILFVMSQRNFCYFAFFSTTRSPNRLRTWSSELPDRYILTVGTKRFRCAEVWFLPAAEKDIVRDVTEKRLQLRFFPRHRAQIDCGHGLSSSRRLHPHCWRQMLSWR